MRTGRDYLKHYEKGSDHLMKILSNLETQDEKTRNVVVEIRNTQNIRENKKVVAENCCG